jgi:isocitrate/isopropylmalate dehydrogenase
VALFVSHCMRVTRRACVGCSACAPGLPCRHKGIDIVMIRENTEGEYSGIEHEVVPGVTEALKVCARVGGIFLVRCHAAATSPAVDDGGRGGC